MTNEEFMSTVQPLHEARPFQPFTIEMNDNTRLEIDIALSLTYRDRTFGYTAKGRGPRIFKTANVRQVVSANLEMAAA